MSYAKALLDRAYSWPRLKGDVEAHVKTCLVYQQHKGEQRRLTVLLEPLPISEKPWESISIDFIIRLLKVDGCGNIMVVVDRFSKYANFIPALIKFNVEDASRLFFKYVVKYWGIPRSIVSD